MQRKRQFRILAAVTSGGIILGAATVAGISATSPGQASGQEHVTLTAQSEAFPQVKLGDCPILHVNYPTGGCVAQLQTDLNIIQGNHLAVDGTFGGKGSQTYDAVIAFQTAQGLEPDGMVGPLTKNALETAVASVPADPVPGATPSAPTGFTVTGDIPVGPSQDQDTHDQTPNAKCSVITKAKDQAIAVAAYDYDKLEHHQVGAQLLAHFLGGSGTEVAFPADSEISNEAAASSEFQDLNTSVQDEIVSQLKAGTGDIHLQPPPQATPLKTLDFEDKSSDLYWGFRGTQGLSVSGGGSLQNGSYVGTLTYVIQDSYGFPPGEDNISSAMRYLQTNCGSPQHHDGAHWFPDSITVTVPFDRPAG